MSTFWRWIGLMAAGVTLSSSLQAAPIHKCVDEQGNVNYTDTACPNGQRLETSFEAINPKPGGDDTVPMAVPPPPPPVPTQPPAPQTVVVVPGAAPPAPEPEVIYVPVQSGSSSYYGNRYRNDYNNRPGSGYTAPYFPPQDGSPGKPPPPKPDPKPRPVWRGETEATRQLIQGGSSRNSDSGSRSSGPRRFDDPD